MRKILIVEDDPRDMELTLYALQNTSFCDEAKVVWDGAEALNYLFRRGEYVNRLSGNPMAILLDVHLPKVGGVEVLKKIRSDPGTRDIPVLILSVLKNDKVINECVALGIHGYLIKPVGIEYLSHALQHAGLSEKKVYGKSPKHPVPETSDPWGSTPELTNALKKLIEIGINKATTTLRVMTGLKLELDSVKITILAATELVDTLRDRIRSKESKIRVVSFDFTGAISGTATLILSYEDTLFIVRAFGKEHHEDDNFAEMYAVDIFSEIGNILINRIVGSIGDLLKKHFHFSAPLYFGTSKTGLILEDESDPHTIVIIAQTCFKVKDKYIDSDITLSIKKDYFEILLKTIENKV